MDKLIGTIARKNDHEQVKVFTTEYGNSLVDIRIKVVVNDKRRTTKEGIILADDAEYLQFMMVDALLAAANEIEEDLEPTTAANTN